MWKIFKSFTKTAAYQVPNEDDGYNDHMVGQINGPFYCGTAFCGHSTKKAARECWRKHCEAWNAINAKANAMRAAGQTKEANLFQAKELGQLCPQNNPANWPINRSSAEMQAEYMERAKKESE